MTDSPQLLEQLWRDARTSLIARGAVDFCSRGKAFNSPIAPECAPM